MNRRDYLRAVVGALGAAACTDGSEAGDDSPRAVSGVVPQVSHSPEEREESAALGVKVVTDYASAVVARGTARENWGPAFEAAWNAAAEEGSDVFVPAGLYPVRLRKDGGGPGPAMTLVQPGKYRPVRMLGPARGAIIRVNEWPEDASPDQEVIRMQTGIRTASGGLDVAVGSQIANLEVVGPINGPMPAWTTPHDHRGVGVRMVGLHSAGVTGCLFRGFSCGVVLGADRGPEVSYAVRVEDNRFQGCNQALRLPATANATSARGNFVWWMHQPSSGPVAAFETRYSTTGVYFTENHAEQCAGWLYRIGASTGVRIQGGRLESVYGGVWVSGTGRYGALGSQIEGLTVDCDSLRYPAVWMERSAGALLSGLTFYQTRTQHPHLMLDRGTAGTTLMGIWSASDAELRVVDRGHGTNWVGLRP